MILLILSIACIGGYNLCQSFDHEQLASYILLIAFVMRIGYMLYTPCTLRPHDLKNISIDSDGHAAYILNILEGHLPTSNEGQFYHPPLYHILSALVILILKPILHLTSDMDVINCARVVSCIFSCITLYCVKSLCYQLKINNFIPLSMVGFLPNFYLMGGRVNNDAIALFFMTLIILFSIRWYQDQNTKNTVILALSFALGMISKLSVAILAISTGILMLCTLIKSFKEHNLFQTIRGLCLFAAASIPLGLSYAIRNFVLFHQPFHYVLDVGSAGFISQNYSYFQRFLAFPITKMFNPIYNNPYTDYNLWLYLLKGGLYGEFRFHIAVAIPAIMLFIYTILSILMMISVVCSLRDKDIEVSYLLLSATVLLVSYIIFNIKYPYGCTMDFRYVAPVFIINSLLFGRFLDKHHDKKFSMVFYGISGGVVLIFSLLSIFMFCII
ncbi:glycosyltransferase family 39 protein [Anaerotignum sp.]|uniref:ArnT family glycosyltransferase n=1 Tax=Anaerotignum sp. TaxID=2039241 RepID=UPI00331DFA67